MKTTILPLALLWIACGLYAYGTVMADFNWKDVHTWTSLNEGSRDNVGLAVVIGLLGPMGAFVAALSTNFNQHGWELWQKEKP